MPSASDGLIGRRNFIQKYNHKKNSKSPHKYEIENDHSFLVVVIVETKWKEYGISFDSQIR